MTGLDGQLTGLRDAQKIGKAYFRVSLWGCFCLRPLSCGSANWRVIWYKWLRTRMKQKAERIIACRHKLDSSEVGIFLLLPSLQSTRVQIFQSLNTVLQGTPSPSAWKQGYITDLSSEASFSFLLQSSYWFSSLPSLQMPIVELFSLWLCKSIVFFYKYLLLFSNTESQLIQIY